MSEQRLPEGVVTFLLTDVEDSTGHWADADGATAMARQRALITEAVKEYGGVQPLEQGEGDSTVSVFISPSGALAAAAAIQIALQAELWPREAVAVRVGLHTGETTLVGGLTYGGHGIIRCARLRDLAHGGQVLVSAATAVLTRDALPTDITLRELTSVQLKGLDRAELCFQLVHPDIRRAFPALGADGVGIRLPSYATSFVGRRAEIDQVSDLVRGARLVTVTGSGGSGKTRLAHQVALVVAPEFADDVVWVDLCRVANSADVASEVAAACGLAESPGGVDALTMVEQHVSSHHRLVVLDNCEHVLDGASTVVDAVLRRGGRSVVVATSREPLGVAGETVWRIPSLDVPRADATTDEARQASAVALFEERARASNPEFEMGKVELATVVAICRRLDGIPLAIELASARLRTMSLDEVVTGLENRFRLLAAGPRSLERQRTLLASIDWSHDLLTERTRVAFRRLSVFARTFTLDDAEAVIPDARLGRLEIFELVAALVDKSLVQAVPGGYQLLESIRPYASQKAADAGELEGLRDRQFHHLLDLTERWRLDPQLTSETLEQTTSHFADLRAALDWGLAVHGPSAWVLVVPLTYALSIENRYDEVNALVQSVLEGVPEGSDAWCRVVAETMGALCVAGQWWMGTVASVLEERGDELDPYVRRRLRVGLASFELMAGVRGAADLVAGLIDEAQRDHDDFFALSNSSTLAYFSALNGDVARAEPYLAWVERQTTDAPLIAANTRGTRIMIAANRCEIDALTDMISELIVEPPGNPTESIAAVTGAFYAGSIPLMRALRDRIQRQEFSGIVEFIPSWVNVSLALLEGELTTASREIEHILTTSIVGTLPLMHVIAADVALACGDRDRAHAQCDQAFALTDGLDCPDVLATANCTAAQIARLDGHVKQAVDFAHVALDVARTHGLVSTQVIALESLAMVSFHAGRVEESARLLGACDAFRDRTRFAWRSHLTPALDELRSSLDPVELEVGASLTIDDAVVYARRHRGARGRPIAGWDALTPAEARVVVLVADGLSNQEVADSLFVSQATIKTHLSHIFQKLDLRSRTQLVNTVRTRESSEHS